MRKKKIYFLAPKNKGGTYYYYKGISEYLIKNDFDLYDIKFVNSLLDYIKLHFIRTDVIFSIIPFLFKPLFTKKYIFNLHGNYKIERKNKGLGVKLLYLTEWNLWFSDRIMLTSYFLADKLDFRKKNENKIIIIPNFIDIKRYDFGKKEYDEKKYRILTITSLKFYDKGKGILNLGKVISKLGDKTNKKIIWTIVGNDDSENFRKIKSEFNKIIFSSNIEIIWKGWCGRKEIREELEHNDYFIYWTFLDNFPGVILEAIASKMKVLVNNFESFRYFLDERIIFKNENEMVERILKNKFINFSVSHYGEINIIKKIKNIIG